MEELHEVYYPLSEVACDKRDVALIELQNAQSLSNNQTKIYSQFANILIASSTLIISIFLNSEKLNIDGLFNQNNLLLFSIFLIIIGILILRYFVDLQKEITINARKVIILRKMLGLNYSSIQLTLPKDRIEGATNPFKIKFFNGWFKFQTTPFWIIIILVSFVWTTNFYTFDINSFNTNKYFVLNEINLYWITGYIFIILIYYFTFRVSLLDKNETFTLRIGVIISKLLKIKLLDNFEYSIYRAKLGYIELERLHIDFKNIKDILIRIEDKNYYKHNGIDFKALVRAILSQSHWYRKRYKVLKSGGSTLTMQLARTIFIPTDQNKIKRKILEFFIAIWLNSVFSKDDLIKVYISSVRYGHNIMGLSEAIQKYFGKKEINSYILSKEKSFFLVERLSSLTNSFNQHRIEHLLKVCDDLGIDDEKVNDLYKEVYNHNR